MEVDRHPAAGESVVPSSDDSGEPSFSNTDTDGAGDCMEDEANCKKKLKKTFGPITIEDYMEDGGESGEDLWNSDAHFYVSSGGDIINEGALSDPESIPSVTTIVDDLDIPEDDDFREWGEIDPSDEEEQEELHKKYYDLFRIPEPEAQEFLLGESEEVNPEDEYYWEDYFKHHFTNEHVNVHNPEKFLKLNLHHDRVTSVAFVPEHFPALKFLDVSKNFVQNIKPLGKLKDLVYLDASDNEITRFLDMCTQVPHPLKEIDLSRNQITEIVRFNRFLALVKINLAYNRLQTVNNFQHCYFLRFLNLSHNNISSIFNLDCPNLLVLLLQGNELESISGLKKCGELRYLNISRNKISDLSALQSLPRLVQLRCAHNGIGLMEMDVLKCLIYMSHLRITPNPCTEISLSRQMLIFTLPQVRYLDKKIILPEEIVEGNNIFNPTFEKIAFEDQTNTMLEKATQSAYMMFREFCEMYPLPSMLFLVGSSKSRAEALALDLKAKFHHRILLGGVHSTGTTIESGNQHDDIPISLEHFMEMKKRGHLFSTSTILGRLCGFSATQFIRAVEHGALLLGIIPLETAICLRNWGFKSKIILLLPSDSPHFNVDGFLEKEKRRRSLHFPEDDGNPKVRENRRISFSSGHPTNSMKVGRQSILKHPDSQDAEAEPLPPLDSTPSRDLENYETLEPLPEPEPTSEQSESESKVTSAAAPEPVPIDQSEEKGEDETGEGPGEDGNQPLEGTKEQITEETLSLFGVKIMNPATIEGIDWKRTILSSDFYEAILTMDEEFHFLVTQNSEDPSIQLSREILLETISTLGYNLVHGPTPIYMSLDDREESKVSEPTEPIKYQLIVVKKNWTSSDLAENSCYELRKHSGLPQHVSFPLVTCADDDIGREVTGEYAGEGGVWPGFPFPIQYPRPTSPWYEPETEGEFEYDDDDTRAEGQNVTDEDEVEPEPGNPTQNKFKHRDALEFAILQTRDKYFKFHLENPGFFVSVLDTRDVEESSGSVQGIVEQMLRESVMDKTSSPLYPLVESYSQVSLAEDAEVFIKERLETIKKLDNAWLRGHPSQHFSTASPSDPGTIFKRTSCPRNLLCTNLPRGYTEGQIYQMQKAEAFRKRNASLPECPGTMNRLDCREKPAFKPVKVEFKEKVEVEEVEVEEVEVVPPEESLGEIEEDSEKDFYRWASCLCVEDCLCQPTIAEVGRTTINFKREALLTEYGYEGDA